MNARDLKPCPFCQEDNDLGIGRGTEDREGFPTYIYCAECGAQGPWFSTRDKANFVSTAVCAENSGWNTRSALPEQPLAKQWREEADKAEKEAEEFLAEFGANDPDYQHVKAKAKAYRQCATDLDAQHDEGRELLRRMVEAVDNFNNTRPEKMVDHVWALGSLLKVTDEARKHLGVESDEA